MSNADFGAVDKSSFQAGVVTGAGVAAAAGSGGGTVLAAGAASGAAQKGMCGSMGGLCGKAHDDEQSTEQEKAALAEKYPYKDCGTNPTNDCMAYNAGIDKIRADELATWQKAKDANTASSLPPEDQKAFALTASIAKSLKAKLPASAGSMSLTQIMKAYPKEFGDAYAAIQAQNPLLKNVPPELLLAMNPTAGNMTLDQLIAKTSSLSGAPSASAGASSSGVAVAGAGLLALVGIFFALKKKK